MTWEEKVEMIELANNVYNKESRQKFLKYVTEHIQKFDSQAYDMFITSMSFVPEEMKEDVEYHKIIFPYINNFINNNVDIKIIPSFRLLIYVEICKKDLNITIK